MSRPPITTRSRPAGARRLVFCWLCCLALAFTLAPAYGQPAPPTFRHDPLLWQPTAEKPATQDAAALAQQSVRLHLPLLQYPPGPPTSISFGTGQADGQLIGEATSFSFGITALHYRVSVVGAEGRTFREEWSLNGVARPELTRSGVLPAAEATYLSAIALSTGAPLPPGSYRLRLLVDDLVGGEAEAIIR